MEKLKINLPIIVEGRYDKSSLMGYLDAKIITTGGFPSSTIRKSRPCFGE
jgi:ribonuclease M5